MIIVMAPNSTQADLDNVISKVKSQGLDVHLSKGTSRTIVGVIGDKAAIGHLEMQHLSGVEKTMRITEKYKLVSREFKRNNTVINVGGVEIGGSKPIVMAGPCAVESMEQLMESATAVAKAGAQFLRGGAFKPRTSPYAFQGMKSEGIRLLELAKQETGMPIISEIMNINDLSLFENVDVIQVGARNMQNFDLLKELGKTKAPILLKRGLANTLEELLMSAEYIMSEGNEQVILCERGIRTFETYTRNTLDLSAVSALHELSHLPVVVDPSHATGKATLVPPMALAAAASGADGLMIEVHNNPSCALCDGGQSLTPEQFHELNHRICKVRDAIF